MFYLILTIFIIAIIKHNLYNHLALQQDISYLSQQVFYNFHLYIILIIPNYLYDQNVIIVNKLYIIIGIYSYNFYECKYIMLINHYVLNINIMAY